MYQAKSKTNIYVVTVWWTHRHIAHFQSCLLPTVILMEAGHSSLLEEFLPGRVRRWKNLWLQEALFMQNSRCERVGQSMQGWESKRQEHHQIWESFSMNRDGRHWSWRTCNDKTWLAGLINILCGRRVIKWITFPLHLEPSHAHSGNSQHCSCHFRKCLWVGHCSVQKGTGLLQPM